VQPRLAYLDFARLLWRKQFDPAVFLSEVSILSFQCSPSLLLSPFFLLPPSVLPSSVLPSLPSFVLDVRIAFLCYTLSKARMTCFGIVGGNGKSAFSPPGRGRGRGR
jgi:hypothetical protein